MTSATEAERVLGLELTAAGRFAGRPRRARFACFAEGAGRDELVLAYFITGAYDAHDSKRPAVKTSSRGPPSHDRCTRCSPIKGPSQRSGAWAAPRQLGRFSAEGPLRRALQG